MQKPISLMGVPGSPYTRKMIAVLRYRRIPYRLIVGSRRHRSDLPRPKVSLLPVFYFETANSELEAVVDSTPIIRRLEKQFAERSVIPPDPAMAFLDALLEDYCDEWLTKAMFHYRWYFPNDVENAGAILPLWGNNGLKGEELQQFCKEIVDRQVSRLYVVGSNDTTAPVIENSYHRYLQIMSHHLESYRYTLGNRPAACDFAAFGQLTQLTQIDPTPMAIARKEAPRVAAWVGIVEDLSGVEPTTADWIAATAIPATLRDLLKEAGRTYVPVMLANARALMSHAETVQTEVDGLPWVQQPFPYQGKCLRWLRETYAALAPDARARVDAILDGTGCEPLLKN